MKFKFCSDGDCPLWALAGLHALSTLPSALFRTLVLHVLYEQPDDNLIMATLKDTKLTTRDECARAVAVIRWVLEQAYSCNCNGSQLVRDMLVLGVPRTHASILAEALTTYTAEYVRQFPTNGFVLDRLVDISVTPGPQATVDTLSMTLETYEEMAREQRRQELLLEKTMTMALLQNLKRAYRRLSRLDRR